MLFPAHVLYSSEVHILARCAQGGLCPQQAGNFHGHLMMKHGSGKKDGISSTMKSVIGL